jgi:hypothetical protein
MNDQAPPCTEGLDEDCFREHPGWAKRVFAYRLLLILAPKPLTKRLARALLRYVLPPGLDVPQDLQLPPGAVVPPGATLPPTYEDGEPLPPGIIPPPSPPSGTDETGTTPPQYVSPWEPGPVTTAPSSGWTAPGYWLWDKFDILDPTIWADASAGAGSIAIDAGRLKCLAPGVGDVAGVRWLVAEPTQPDTFTLWWDMNHIAGVGQILQSIRTGSHWIMLAFDPPNSMAYLNAACGAAVAATNNITGVSNTWKLEYNGAAMTLWQDSAKILDAVTPCVSAGNKGQRFFTLSDGDTTYLDNYKIQEL